MQVSLEKTNTFERRLTVDIPKERIEQEVQKRLKSLASTTKIKGFRAGRVPMRILEKKYGQQARQEAIGEIIQSSFTEAAQEHQCNVIEQPTINIKDNESGVSYTADFVVMPSADEIQIEGLKVEKPVSEIQELDIDAMIEKLRRQRQEWEEIQGPAELGDEINIKYRGSIGEVPENSEFHQTSVVLGKQNELPGLDSALTGCSVGDTREFDAEFPEDHSEAALAGNTVHFVVIVQSIIRLKPLPEVNADFIKSFGMEEGTEEALRDGIRANLEQTLRNLVQNSVKRQVLNALLAKNPIEVPKSLIDSEMQRLQSSREELIGEELAERTKVMEAEAKTRVQLGMLINELIKANQIQATPEKMKELIEEFSSAYEDSQAAADLFYKSPQRMREVEAIVLENAVVDLLIQNAEVTEKKMSFYELTEQQGRG